MDWEKKFDILITYMADSAAEAAAESLETETEYSLGYFDAAVNILKVVREIYNNDFETYSDFAGYMEDNLDRIDTECEGEKELLLSLWDSFPEGEMQ